LAGGREWKIREGEGAEGVNEDFELRRAAARARLDAIDPHKRLGGVEADPRRRQWFETVYAQAGDDPAAVPWARLSPHPLLDEWLAGQGRLDALRVIDIGCGLGDNAEAFAAAGARVTAFDLVEGAISWAKRRFPESRVDYQTADLFNLPSEWRSRFDLVNECYTLQALPDALLPRAAQCLASLVASRGRLLVIARAREEAQHVDGPPWPLARSRIESLAVDGLRLETLEDIPPEGPRGRHWRALFRRAPEVAAEAP
jgi:2-polyprenyl-3-methyl-5-hydroxy-6-metoxy-1,4-benzoquinol methylase